MYRSYSYNSMPEPVNTHTSKENLHTSQNDCSGEKNATPPPISSSTHSENSKPAELPFGLEKDDIILLIVIAILILNECDDTILLLALAYIFFADYFKF